MDGDKGRPCPPFPQPRHTSTSPRAWHHNTQEVRVAEGGLMLALPVPALGTQHTLPDAGCWAGRWLVLFTRALSLPSPICEQGARPVPVPISTRRGVGGRGAPVWR